MTCGQCGCNMGVGVQFCQRCGAPAVPYGTALAATPALSGYPAGPLPAWAMPRMRVEQHGQALGVALLVYGAFRLLSLLSVGLAFHAVVQGGLLGGLPPELDRVITGSIPLILLVISATSALEIVSGFGLLTRKPWARVLAIVAGCLALFKLPFGTALGVYTLWVLAPRASGEEWAGTTAGR